MFFKLFLLALLFTGCSYHTHLLCVEVKTQEDSQSSVQIFERSEEAATIIRPSEVDLLLPDAGEEELPHARCKLCEKGFRRCRNHCDRNAPLWGLGIATTAGVGIFLYFMITNEWYYWGG